MQTALSRTNRALIALISLRRAFNLKYIFQILIPTLVRSRHVRSPSQIFVRTNIIRCRATRAYGTKLQFQGSLFEEIPTQVDYSHTKNAYPKCSLPLHHHLGTYFVGLHIMQIGVSTHYRVESKKCNP